MFKKRPLHSHGGDSIPSGYILCLVDIALQEVDIGVLFRQGLVRRSNCMARTTPLDISDIATTREDA